MKEITYTMREDGLMYPDLTLPEEPTELGAYAMRHKKYLEQHHKGRFSLLVLQGRLNTYLAEVEQTALDMLEKLTEQMAQTMGVTEQLKAENQMEWVQRMNSIRQSAEEIVNAEVIYN